MHRLLCGRVGSGTAPMRSEGIYPILGPGFVSVQNTGSMDLNIVHIKHESGTDVVVTVINDMYGGFGAMTLVGTKKAMLPTGIQRHVLLFQGSTGIICRVSGTGVRPFPFDETIELMKIIIAGIRVGKRVVMKYICREISAEIRMAAST